MTTLAQNLIEVEDQWGAHNYHPLPVVIREASGAWVTDVEGRRYLDMLSAYSAINARAYSQSSSFSRHGGGGGGVVYVGGGYAEDAPDFDSFAAPDSSLQEHLIKFHAR